MFNNNPMTLKLLTKNINNYYYNNVNLDTNSVRIKHAIFNGKKMYVF